MGLLDVFRELQAAREAGVIGPYALGGAVAATVYLEPADTEDVDIFLTVAAPASSSLVSFEPVYSFLKKRGAVVKGERLEVGGWLVQLLPPPSALVEDAVQRAAVRDVDGAQVPVMTAEHLAAIAVETGRLKDKLRVRQFLEWDGFDRAAFLVLVDRFGLRARWEATERFLKENE